MATNDFSASSTSASLGGSYGPVAASVSYSTDSMHSSSTSNTSDTYHKTMIAKYSVCFIHNSFIDLMLTGIVPSS